MEHVTYRHELKFIISFSDYYSVKERLKRIARPDENAGSEGGYRIRSLYFDNIYDKALREKVYGVNNREKFRIRYYNGDTSVIKLEKKSKINGLCNKRTTKLTKEECEELLAGRYHWLLEAQDVLKHELYAKIQSQLLRPRSIVDYYREPYIYNPGNVRITFDTDIRSGIYAINLFDPDLSGIYVAADTILMEVKYDAFLPDIICDMIRTNRCQALAFSKYAGSRIYG